MKVFKYLFISSIMFAVTSCGNDWLDLAPSTQVDTETSINVLSDIERNLQHNAKFRCILRPSGILWRCNWR